MQVVKFLGIDLSEISLLMSVESLAIFFLSILLLVYQLYFFVLYFSGYYKLYNICLYHHNIDLNNIMLLHGKYITINNINPFTFFSLVVPVIFYTSSYAQNLKIHCYYFTQMANSFLRCVFTQMSPRFLQLLPQPCLSTECSWGFLSAPLS